ncbi:hypothetical protein, partial [Hymenobacter rubidus]|uniref:hypothetical protein n=1 Tax=Hymenobacter rubidus TaxID=1441626 RepID=UPI001F43976C
LRVGERNIHAARLTNYFRFSLRERFNDAIQQVAAGPNDNRRLLNAARGTKQQPGRWQQGGQ